MIEYMGRTRNAPPSLLTLCDIFFVPPDSVWPIPTHCLVGSATGVGAAVLFANLHKGTAELPSTCIAGTMAAAGTVGAVLAHHNLRDISAPPVTCWIGSAAILGGIYYLLAKHATPPEKTQKVGVRTSVVSCRGRRHEGRSCWSIPFAPDHFSPVPFACPVKESADQFHEERGE